VYRVQELVAALVRANHAAACAYVEEVAMDKSQHGIGEHLAPVRASLMPHKR
jgi:hypothetical protein